MQLSPATGTGNSIGAPPGRKTHVFYDGTDMDYVDMPEVGAAFDLHINTTTVPPWITTACTVRPYLLKDGTVYTSSVYPQLAALLGSTYGGNGATTFGVPNELSRLRLPVDTSGSAGRVTAAGSGVNGTTLGAAGGSEFMQIHNHAGIVAAGQGSHNHGSPNTNFVTNGTFSASGGGGAAFGSTVDPATSAATLPQMTVTNSSTGSGGSQNMPPVIVNFLPLVKT